MEKTPSRSLAEEIKNSEWSKKIKEKFYPICLLSSFLSFRAIGGKRGEKKCEKKEKKKKKKASNAAPFKLLSY